MQKVIRKLTPENNMDFENICSFETDSYIGIWDQANDTYAIMKKSDFEFGYINYLNVQIWKTWTIKFMV